MVGGKVDSQILFGTRSEKPKILFGTRDEKRKNLFGNKWQLRKILFSSQRVKKAENGEYWERHVREAMLPSLEYAT